MPKILVTGGAGFIGSSLAEKLSHKADNQIIIVDNLLTGSISKLPVAKHNNIRFIHADINVFEEISAVFLANNFDYVFHYAALVGVQRTQRQPLMVLNDINGIRNVLALSKNTGVKRIYYASSSEVYGEPAEFPQNEHTTPLNSRVPYAIVKNLGEAFLRSYNVEFGMEFTIFRFFNTYGPKQSVDFVISRFMSMALSNQDITIFGDGSQTRTFCHIDDNIDATLNAFYENQLINEVANIGNDHETTVLELANQIIALTGSSSQIVHLSALLDGDMTRRKPDITKMKSLLNRPLLPLSDGLKRLLTDTRYILPNV